tara:strand:- start:620 stop:1372 length:753 start_codon:yes stop_codon:yes gene_type:complete
MADAAPIKAVFNASNVATGLAEFQASDTVALSNGGLGVALTLGSAGEVLKVNSGGTAVEFGSGAVSAETGLTGTTLASGITASSLTSVGTLTTLTVDNIIINGTTIGHTDDTDLITLASGSVTIAGDLTVSGTTVTTNQQVVNVTEAFVFEGATADANETTFSIDEPTADRTVALPDKTGTIELLDGLILNSTDGSANAGDNIVQNTSANDGDRILLEDATSDPILVLASHGITLSGVGWNTFQFDNDHS